jgi:hypothetical protein
MQIKENEIRIIPRLLIFFGQSQLAHSVLIGKLLNPNNIHSNQQEVGQLTDLKAGQKIGGYRNWNFLEWEETRNKYQSSRMGIGSLLLNTFWGRDTDFYIEYEMPCQVDSVGLLNSDSWACEGD